MKGQDGELFDMTVFQEGEKDRKNPQPETMGRIDGVDDRLLKNLEQRVHRAENLTAADYDTLKELRAKYGQEPIPELPDHVVTRMEDVAAHFGKVRRTVINWTKRNPAMPKAVHGYDLIEIGTWALKEGLIQDSGLIPGNVAPSGDGEDPDDTGPNRQYYEKEIKRLDAELKDLKLAEVKGELLKRPEVAGEFADRAREVSKGLDYLENALPPLLEGKSQGEMRNEIRKQTRSLRNQYAREGIFIPALDMTECPSCGSFFFEPKEVSQDGGDL